MSIKANFSTYATYTTDSLYQWDKNQVLSVYGLNLSTAPEVHFSNSKMDKAIVRQATLSDHVVSVQIPNSLLQEAFPISAHIGIYEGDTFKTVEVVKIPIIAKKRPADYQIETTDEEIYSFEALRNALGNKADNARVDNIIAHNNDTDGNSELVDIRVGVTGKTYESAGTAIREQFFTQPLPYPAIEKACDLNNYTAPGNYVFAITSGISNLPDSLVSGDIPRYLKIECFGERIPTLNNIQTWGKQTFYTVNGDKEYCRYFNYDYSSEIFIFTEWRSTGKYNFKILENEVDLNGIVENDNYIVATTEAINTPISGRGFLLNVTSFSYGWILQEAYGLHNNPCHFYRVGNNPSNSRTNGVDTVTWSEWQTTISKSDVLPNVGYIIANMGDSVVGNVQDNTSVSAFLAELTGAKVYNLGFGGCRMSTHYTPWDAFSMYKLADAIVQKDFTLQEEAAQHTDVPSYFVNTVKTLKALDFSTVDILTIAYGLNDYTAGKTLDNPNNAKDTDYYCGALRYAIETLLKAYPNLKIVIVAPTWCHWIDSSGNSLYDSDTKSFNSDNNVLPDFVGKCLELGKEYHIPVVNPYYELSINKYNFSRWFNNGDGFHPNETGRRDLAKLIAKTIGGM